MHNYNDNNNTNYILCGLLRKLNIILLFISFLFCLFFWDLFVSDVIILIYVFV